MGNNVTLFFWCKKDYYMYNTNKMKVFFFQNKIIDVEEAFMIELEAYRCVSRFSNFESDVLDFVSILCKSFAIF